MSPLSSRVAALTAVVPFDRPAGEALAALRAHIADVVAGGKPSGPPRPTGLVALDGLLGGGLPRGRLTEVTGQAGSGITTLVRQLVARTLADGGWVAVLDVSRTLAPRPWGALVAQYGPRLWMVRPPLTERRRAAWCADLLLRTGAFALVVLDGAPVLRRATGVRLAQLAREQDAALVAVRYGARASDLGGAVRLRVEAVPSGRTGGRADERTRGRIAPRAAAAGRRQQRAQHLREQGAQADEGGDEGGAERLRVVVERGGDGHGQQHVEVTCAVSVADRVCAHPEVPDRRGVARRTRHKWDVADTPVARAVAGGGAAPPPAAGADDVALHTRTDGAEHRIEITRGEAFSRGRVGDDAVTALGRPPARARRRARAQ